MCGDKAASAAQEFTFFWKSKYAAAVDPAAAAPTHSKFAHRHQRLSSGDCGGAEFYHKVIYLKAHAERNARKWRHILKITSFVSVSRTTVVGHKLEHQFSGLYENLYVFLFFG